VKWLFVTLIALSAGAALAVILHNDPGYVLMRYGPWSVEMSLAVLVFFAIVACTTGYWAVRLIGELTRLPARSRAWRKRRRQSKATSALAHAIIAEAEGDHALAERGLIAHVGDSPYPEIHYLLAARHAFSQQAYNRADDYIALACTESSHCRVAALLTQSELQISAKQYDLALAAARQVREYEPANLRSLALLAKIYEGQQDWPQLAALAPELDRTKAVSDAEFQRLEHTAYQGILERTAQMRDPVLIHQAWTRIPKTARDDPATVQIYAQSLVRLGHGEMAETVVEETLQKAFNPSLARLYGLIEGGNARRRFERTRGWISEHGPLPALQLAAARLCMRLEIWAQAREHLLACLNQGDTPEALQVYADLLEREGDRDAAKEYYRKAAISWSLQETTP